MKPHEEILKELTQDLLWPAYRLAVLGLQSKRYQRDPEFKEAVDAVIDISFRSEEWKGKEDEK